MEIKTAGDLLIAIASGQGWGKEETDFFLQSSFLYLSLGLRSAGSKNNGKASVDRIQLYTLSFCRNLQLGGFLKTL